MIRKDFKVNGQKKFIFARRTPRPAGLNAGVRIHTSEYREHLLAHVNLKTIPRAFSPRKFINFHGQVRLKVLVAITILLVSLVSSQLVFANNLAVDGQKLSEINGKIKDLEAQNTTLTAEIAKVSSLTHLSKKAQEAGFVKPQTVNIH